MKVKMKDGWGEYVFTQRSGAGHLYDGKLVPMEITQRIHVGADCYPWREVFAIWPVRTISGRRVWLQKIYKRRFWVVWGVGFHMEPHVEYGELFDILAETQ